MFPVFFIQVKGHPYQYRCSDYTKSDAHPLVNAYHIYNDKHDKYSEQASGEYEKVLGFQAFELHTSSYPFINIMLHNYQLYEADYRKKERRMVAATIRKIHAPNHEAAVLLVSGSPELNFPSTFTPPIKPTTAPIAYISFVPGSK